MKGFKKIFDFHNLFTENVWMTPNLSNKYWYVNIIRTLTTVQFPEANFFSTLGFDGCKDSTQKKDYRKDAGHKLECLLASLETGFKVEVTMLT